ncbi:AraC family transcriptional regulator [Mycolicibacterium sp. GCM10028919]|uniref:AraC family transcriptional regulator n=1 Tax=Mycolicibacterium sp. GCM10028919 TaxID=3273401 RepID=UPI0036140289
MSDALATLFAEACPVACAVDIGAGATVLPGDEALRVHVVFDASGIVTTGATSAVPVAPGGVFVTGGEPVTLTVNSPGFVVTGGYEVGGSVCDRVLRGMPEVVVAEPDQHTAGLTSMLGAEVRAGRAGHQAVMIRLLDLLAVTTIRRWLEHNPDSTVSWATAHTDPVVGPALSLLHDQPGAPWTVDVLARRVGSSRSALSRRFAVVLGESPMGYLTCWRMCLSADLLAKTDLPIDAVARRVGYANAYGFSAAFHRHHGVRPGHYRRTAASAAEAPRR